MNNDLKIIKKYYGERFMHLCRSLFATILDNSPGILPKLLLDNFHPTHFLYDDLVIPLNNYYHPIINFKNYIYKLYDDLFHKEDPIYETVPDPKTLMHQAGYTLYECHTEEDIQRFKKYYQKDEALCTFNGGRLDRCYVYFAVKDNANELNRNNFAYPYRQDAYGTSVISIQFTKDSTYTLSIKNRYNHTVANPDATFSNNLDNIIPGLTQSFADHYGMKQLILKNQNFGMLNYVMANDGKFYRFNYEINNVYYCPGNIVIDNFQVIKYSPESYLVFDYFILDLVNKRIINRTKDKFSETIPDIKKISIINQDNGKMVTITPVVGEDVILVLDKYQRLIKLTDSNILNVPNDYLSTNLTLSDVNLPNAEIIGHYFLCNNSKMKEISLPNVHTIGHYFMGCSKLTKLNLPKVEKIGVEFLANNSTLEAISLPNAKIIGNGFLFWNSNIHIIELPKITGIGHTRLMKDTNKERAFQKIKKQVGD